MQKLDSYSAVAQDIFGPIVQNIEVRGADICLYSSSPAGEPLKLAIAELAQTATAEALGRYIYAHYYACDAGLFDQQAEDPLYLLGARQRDPEFVESLRAANPATGYPSHGWTVTGYDEQGDLFVTREGLTLLADTRACIDVPQRPVEIGESISIRFPPAAVYAMPGFFLMFSDYGPPEARFCTRFYLNLVPNLAARLIRHLLGDLLADRTPYTLKTVNDRRAFVRRDNTVLYVARTDYESVAASVASIWRRMPDAFRNTVPSFTLRLCPGIGVADDPVDYTGTQSAQEIISFGEHRSRLVAQGIAGAFAGGAQQPDRFAQGAGMRDAILTAVCAQLTTAGLDPDRPYLRSINALDYAHECEGWRELVDELSQG